MSPLLLLALWPLAVESKGTPIEYSAALRATILEQHNKFRRTVSPPAATPLKELTWDSTLEKAAADRAAMCVKGHLGGPYGENLGYGGSANTLGDWFGSEVKWWTYPKCNAPPKRSCLHYTQIIWETTTKMACASRQCPNIGPLHVCKYSPAGNYQYQSPYVKRSGSSSGATTGSGSGSTAGGSSSSGATGGSGSTKARKCYRADTYGCRGPFRPVEGKNHWGFTVSNGDTRQLIVKDGQLVCFKPQTSYIWRRCTGTDPSTCPWLKEEACPAVASTTVDKLSHLMRAMSNFLAWDMADEM